ncbi:MAG: threonine--tRNA ligase [Phycisphaerales bacterium]|nr:threonine--tRNA ligase [Planctomycetota bacterium]MCH8507441.1 threonine--tRNA ligase [Phycisphaerales bacterium]
MPRITLPDGSVKEFESPVTARQVAESIGARLAQAAVGCRVDGELADLGTVLDRDCSLAIVTEKTRAGDPDPDALFLLRHSTAHVMAEAIQRIVPGAQLVYGPPLDTGFYYDIAFPEDRPLKEGDFEAIEAEMARIVKNDRPFTRYELPVDEGMAKLKGEGSKYKIDNAEQAVKAGSDRLSFYATGEPGKDWEDLCRGPHVPGTGRIGAFKVMSLASSYWHGDENSDRLTRVYGTAFFSKKDLDAHMMRIEEARKRDHRVLGRKLQLFHIDEQVGQGLILWTPRGSVIRKELQDWIGGELRKMGYTDVYCPHIGKLDLYKTSGHFPYYAESQFVPVMERDFLSKVSDEGCSCSDLSNMMGEGDIEGYLLKPMNCPHHIKIFDSQPRSYRDLPIRLSEFGTVYRWEQSGELNGMTRVRCFTVDDAHLFCREDQVGEEVRGCLKLVKIAFETLGLTDFRIRVGLRDPDSSKYVGDPAVWDKAEAACREAASELGAKVSMEPGEAAFYGPKIDFVVKDVIGREWQLGTVQVDYNLPQRFDLSYVGADNQRHRPVMIHRAPFGSLERFVGVLIEHFAGAFPLWLSPEQVRVLPISEKSNDYAKEVVAKLTEAGLRATLDDSDNRVQGKIKAGSEMKIPYLLVVGPRDAENRAVSVRAFGEEKDLGQMPLEDFVAAAAEEHRGKGKVTVKDRMPAGV